MAAPSGSRPHPQCAGKAYPVLAGPSEPCPLRSVELPVAVTDLSKLLADDATLCAGRPWPPVAKDQPPDVRLTKLIAAWPALPERTRTAVLAVIAQG